MATQTQNNKLLQAAPGLSSEAAPGESTVRVNGSHYLVDFGPDVQPRNHTVDKLRRCNCVLGSDCPAIAVVQNHLESGGAQASFPPLGRFDAIPRNCPICREPTTFEQALTSKQRGIGWVCSQAGACHYWQTLGQRLWAKHAIKQIHLTARRLNELGLHSQAAAVIRNGFRYLLSETR